MSLRMMIFIPLSCAMTVAATAQARLDARPFLHRNELHRDGDGISRVGRIVFDSAIYSATDESYSNFRIVDADGAEVPYMLRRRICCVTQVVENAVASEVREFRTREDNSASIVVEVKKPEFRPGAVILRTQHRNYEKLVSIYGGYSPDCPEPVVSNARIYDYSRHIDVRNNRVELPANDFRYLRIELSNFVEQKSRDETEVITETRGDIVFGRSERRTLREESIRIDGVDVIAKISALKPREQFLAPYSSGELAQATDPRQQTSAWTFGTDRQPLVSFTLMTPSRNFSRRAIVEGRSGGEKQQWRRVGEGTIFSLDLDSMRDSQLTIPLKRETRCEEYRIVVHNQDNPPLDVTGIVASGHVYEAFFVADPAASYALLYGGENIRQPRYDIGAVLKNLDGIDDVEYRMRGEIPNPVFRAGFNPAGFKPKMLFVFAMIAVTVLLGWFIAKGAGKVSRIE